MPCVDLYNFSNFLFTAFASDLLTFESPLASRGAFENKIQTFPPTFSFAIVHAFQFMIHIFSKQVLVIADNTSWWE